MQAVRGLQTFPWARPVARSRFERNKARPVTVQINHRPDQGKCIRSVVNKFCGSWLIVLLLKTCLPPPPPPPPRPWRWRK